MTTVIELGAAAKGWLTILGITAVQGLVLVLAALVLTRATRRGSITPAWQAGLWFVVVFKLALPWGPAMPYSLSDLVAMFTDHEGVARPFVLTPDLVRAAPVQESWPAVGWIALASFWALGAIVVLSRAVVGYARILRAARAARPAPAAAVQLLRDLGSWRTILVVGDAETGPHVVGTIRPRIVVPPALLEDTTLLRVVLLHELAHVRRFDALARVVQVIASMLMWWNPIIRLVHRKLELAREAACDAWALESAEIPRPAYARLLVRMASLNAPALSPALAAPRALDERVTYVLGPPARARMGLVQRVVVAAWALVALGGARSAAARGKPDLCVYTTQLAAALYNAFPDADADGDGMLSHDEACELQAELKRGPEERMSMLSADDEAKFQALVAEPLFCNAAVDATASPESVMCTKAEGNDR